MAPEDVFGQKYVLLRKLAEGGMAEIYLSRQIGIGGFQKELVIKRIHQTLADNEQYVELFLDEARIAANLNHPNIVHIYDIGRAVNTYYIAMEYIRGPDLADIARRSMSQGAPLAPARAAEIVCQVAEGLHFAHSFRDKDGRSLSIIHRDISPSNILVTYGGICKLVDFGIAKARTQLHDDSGALMGKLGYMAPELLGGHPADMRTDLFSLGVVLHEITTGKHLYVGDDKTVARKILHDPIPPPSVFLEDYPSELEVVVMRLLEKRPENRYQDADELQQDLRDVMLELDWPTGPIPLGRHLTDLFDLDAEELDLDDLELEEEDLELDDDVELELGPDDPTIRGAPPCAPEEDEEEEDELIFASRLPDPFDD
jgi:serine/threonine-protein kinase